MSKISEITFEELLELYAGGRRDFTRFTVRDTDIDYHDGVDLRGVKFRAYSLEDIIYALQYSNLSGADLRSVSFRQANLDGCNLSGAKLNKASLWEQV
ncbi:MAG: pentapeptide repeat-containing protein, partial [Okeania sp. SIO2H7]|nr:pentapeptide repeat-containing protein [Okeania sp. SIO2H7]